MIQPYSPLSVSQYVRDLWGHYDPIAIAQLAPLADESCYQPKFYKAPSPGLEVMANRAYVPYGLKITPGDIIYGFYLPCSPATGLPPNFSVQITDQDQNHQFFSEPIPSFMIANSLGCGQAEIVEQKPSFPYLLNAPYPVTGEGLFLVELWNNLTSSQRIELVIGALEVVE
jgi:hypothetical protein